MSGEMQDPAATRDPGATYRERRARHRDVAGHLRRAGETLAWVRLGVFAAGLAAAWFSLYAGWFDWPWLLAPLAVFLGLLAAHDRVLRGRRRAERAAEHYDDGLKRLDDRWAGRGSAGDAFLDPEHPYSADLDLFGRGSLFELLCAARTVSGERTLAAWLGSPAAPAEVRERQEAVRELRERLDLREELALTGDEVRSEVDPDALAAWAGAPPGLSQRWVPWVAALLAALNLAALAWWPWSPVGGLPFLATVLCSIGFVARFRSRVDRVLAGAGRQQRGLELLARVLARFERERFSSAMLVRLRAELETGGQPPSVRVARLARLVQLNDSRHNMLFQPLASLLLLGTQLAFAMERWRRESGAAVGRWLGALGALEALSSLARHAWERPEDPFPEIVAEGPRLEGAGLGHPLLPAARSVRNDVRLGGDLRLLIVSGSNMSGKSTLLRTVGVNTVLALAGGPVRARSLTVSPLAVGAAMRVQDSLQEGLSHFYAEIRRLRKIVDLGTGELPLLFLLDEILHGTNSHDRRIGAEALLRGLVERGAVGLVTTHDLALASIAERLAPRAVNVHFEDQLEGDRISFDYRLRPGVVAKGNALELMRAIGLEID